MSERTQKSFERPNDIGARKHCRFTTGSEMATGSLPACGASHKSPATASRCTLRCKGGWETYTVSRSHTQVEHRNGNSIVMCQRLNHHASWCAQFVQLRRFLFLNLSDSDRIGSDCFQSNRIQSPSRCREANLSSVRTVVRQLSNNN